MLRNLVYHAVHIEPRQYTCLLMAMNRRRRLSTLSGKDDRQIGDYPNVPRVSTQLRDPYANYTSDKQERRNANEDVHEEDEILGMWVYDQDPSVSTRKALAWLLGAFGVLGLLGLLVAAFHPEDARLAVPRDLPYAYQIPTEKVPAKTRPIP
jgi:NADH dehydrogenase (ubiquinone) 1 beta subcomplex subunit 8